MFAIYENQEQMTGIIYDEDAIVAFKKEANKHKKPFIVYVFSYDHTYNEEDFEDMVNLKTVKPIPEVILNVYRKIYKELYKPRHL
jgi:adenine-specific DNA-methyltransferase